ncbi:MAG: hypothetical protein M3552_14405 [Planctomycetota bacterium]|nr:hypothetical protein [Planctomycetota bacterium]
MVLPLMLLGCGSGVKADPKASAAAEWTLRRGGAVRVADQPGMVRQIDRLPGGGFGLEEIDLNDADPNQPPIRDDELRALEGLTNLRKLGLYGANVTDKGAETIATLKSLRELELSQTQITDTGLETLAKLPNLEKLFIRNVGDKVTDDGVKQFERRTGAEVFR